MIICLIPCDKYTFELFSFFSSLLMLRRKEQRLGIKKKKKNKKAKKEIKILFDYKQGIKLLVV